MKKYNPENGLSDLILDRIHKVTNNEYDIRCELNTLSTHEILEALIGGCGLEEVHITLNNLKSNIDRKHHTPPS